MRMKAWRCKVDGYPVGVTWAVSRGKARMRVWLALQDAGFEPTGKTFSIIRITRLPLFDGLGGAYRCRVLGWEYATKLLPDHLTPPTGGENP
jgi:hypothetical protein